MSRIGTRRALLNTSTVKNGLLNNLVAYWPLNEASGNGLDAHTSGYTLTAYNTPGAAAGLVYPTARSFDGGATEQYFQRSYTAALTFGDVDHTVAMWVYHDAWATNPPLEYHQIIQCGENFAGGFGAATNALHQVVGTWLAEDNKPAQIHGNSLSALGAWDLLLFSWDAANSLGKVGVNVADWVTGAEVGKRIAATPGHPLTVGAHQADVYYFQGRIGPLMVWNRLLSDADRAALYNAGLGLPYASFTL